MTFCNLAASSEIHKTFGFLLDTERLISGNAIDLDELQRKCADFAAAF